VRNLFVRRSWRQRIIALVGAYAVAFAGMIASLSAAQAAANPPDATLCHAAQSPADQTDSKICIDYSCCTGCLAMAAAVPPPSSLIGPPQLSFKRLDLPAHSVRRADAKANAHRSRGPPPAL
jgi:hypothetical protein